MTRSELTLRGLPQGVFDALDCQLALLTVRGDLLFVNEAWSRSLADRDLPAAVGDVGSNYLHAVRGSRFVHSERVARGVEAVLQHRVHRFSIDYPQLHDNGGGWFHMSVTSIEVSGSRYAVIAHCPLPAKSHSRPLPRGMERLERIINSVPHVLWIANGDGRVGYFNAAWLRLTGAGAGANVETVLFNRIHEGDREQWRARWRHAVRSGEPYETEYRLRAGNGESAHWYLERGTPLRRSGSHRAGNWLVTATRIDEDKHREEELRRMVDRRDEFFATLLHELRNPLAPIANAVDMLGRAVSDAVTVRFASGVIQRQMRQLTRLVDDLLDVSRIVRGNVILQRRRVDLGEVIGTAIETAKPVIQLRGHELSAGSTDAVIEADPVRLAQVFTNVLINAAKYTQPGGHIWVDAAREENVVTVKVVDDGIGIAAEKMSEIFELFSQATPGSVASRSGLGIGLAVAKQLVQLHGGSISARSEGLGRGSEFTIKLPLTCG
jgi:PAS domain S-box-containing protein